MTKCDLVKADQGTSPAMLIANKLHALRQTGPTLGGGWIAVANACSTTAAKAEWEAAGKPTRELACFLYRHTLTRESTTFEALLERAENTTRERIAPGRRFGHVALKDSLAARYWAPAAQAGAVKMIHKVVSEIAALGTPIARPNPCRDPNACAHLHTLVCWAKEHAPGVFNGPLFNSNVAKDVADDTRRLVDAMHDIVGCETAFEELRRRMAKLTEPVLFGSTGDLAAAKLGDERSNAALNACKELLDHVTKQLTLSTEDGTAPCARAAVERLQAATDRASFVDGFRRQVVTPWKGPLRLRRFKQLMDFLRDVLSRAASDALVEFRAAVDPDMAPSRLRVEIQRGGVGSLHWLACRSDLKRLPAGLYGKLRSAVAKHFATAMDTFEKRLTANPDMVSMSRDLQDPADSDSTHVRALLADAAALVEAHSEARALLRLPANTV